MTDRLLRIRESLIAATAPGRECRQIGPFYAMLSPHDDMVWMNYAVPNKPLELHFPAALDELEAHFRSLNRSPRFEYFPELAPTLEQELVKRGYELQGRMPMMVCSADTFIPRIAEDAKLLEPDDDIARASAIANRAFGSSDDPTEEQTNRNREAMREGRMKIAISDVAAAFLVGDHDVAELCGVGTLPEHRRKGKASKVSSALMTAQFINPNALVWLSAGDETAKLVYERLGFVQTGEQLNYILTK